MRLPAGSSALVLKVLAEKVILIPFDQFKHAQPSTAAEYAAHNQTLQINTGLFYSSQIRLPKEEADTLQLQVWWW